MSNKFIQPTGNSLCLKFKALWLGGLPQALEPKTNERIIHELK